MAIAVASVFEQVKMERAKREEPSVYLINGAGRPITTELERAYSDLQRSTQIAREILDSTIRENNFHKEKAAALTHEAFQRLEHMALLYADLATRSPDSALVFRKMAEDFLERAASAGASSDGSDRPKKNYLVNS